MTVTDVIGSQALRDGAETTMSAERAQLLEALSQRILRHCDVEVWRKVFLGPAYASIRFEAVQLTMVAADAPMDSFSGEEAHLLAARLGGNPELSSRVDFVLSFRNAAAALGASLLLQRLAPRRRVRTALSTQLCTVARYELDGAQRRLVVGSEMQHAEEALSRAVPGTILISAETYALVGDRLAEYVPDGLLATELEGDRVREASITLAPHASAAQSTFAGLGLV